MDSERAIRAMVADLVNTWNAGDAEGFARHFAEDADFVNVQGMYDSGRATIATAHRSRPARTS